MTIHIVTDSASDISLEEAKELGIEIVPLSVRFGEAEYTDLIDLSVSDFYQKMSERTASQLPLPRSVGCI